MQCIPTCIHMWRHSWSYSQHVRQCRKYCPNLGKFILKCYCFETSKKINLCHQTLQKQTCLHYNTSVECSFCIALQRNILYYAHHKHSTNTKADWDTKYRNYRWRIISHISTTDQYVNIKNILWQSTTLNIYFLCLFIQNIIQFECMHILLFHHCGPFLRLAVMWPRPAYK